jgi:AhpD family alkylhydroperoxidase
MKLVLNYPVLTADLRGALYAVTRQLPGEGFPKSLQHLIDIRVSQMNGCQFCLNMHTKEALADGENSDRIDAISTWRTAEAFDPAERSALNWAELLTRAAAGSATLDEAMDLLRPHFSEEAICRLTFSVALINAWNRVGVGFYRHD